MSKNNKPSAAQAGAGESQDQAQNQRTETGNGNQAAESAAQAGASGSQGGAQTQGHKKNKNKGAKKGVPAAPGAKMVTLSLRNKTGNPVYYRCGRRIGKAFTDITVTAEDAVKLRSDPWIEEQK